MVLSPRAPRSPCAGQHASIKNTQAITSTYAYPSCADERRQAPGAACAWMPRRQGFPPTAQHARDHGITALMQWIASSLSRPRHCASLGVVQTCAVAEWEYETEIGADCAVSNCRTSIGLTMPLSTSTDSRRSAAVGWRSTGKPDPAPQATPSCAHPQHRMEPAIRAGTPEEFASVSSLRTSKLHAGLRVRRCPPGHAGSHHSPDPAAREDPGRKW